MASPVRKPRRPTPALALTRQHPRACPICHGDQHVLVSEKSRRRDVSEDTFALTVLGRQVLEEMRAQERAEGYWRRYHSMEV